MENNIDTQEQKLLKEGNGDDNQKPVRFNNYIVVIIILIISVALFLGAKDNDDTEEITQNDNVATTTTQGVVLIVVNDQPAGSIVKIDSISVPEPVWVAVYEDKGGDRGNILGARKAYPNSSTTQIYLLRDTVPGQLYYVVLHKDSDGDDDFNFKTTDTPYIKAEKEVVKTFNTTQATQ